MTNRSFTNKQLEDADLQGNLISHIAKLDRMTLMEDFSTILVELHNSDKISLLSKQNLSAINNLTHNEFWNLSHTLNKTISELNCSHQEIINFVWTLVNKAGSDLVANAPNTELIDWCKANPKKALLIVEEAKSLDEISINHCVFAIQGIDDENLAFDLLQHPENKIRALGLLSLGRVDIKDIIIVQQVINECCTALIKETDQNIRFSAINCAFNTWKRYYSIASYRQIEFIEIIILDNHGDELVQLSASLFHHLYGLIDESIDLILDAITGEVSNPLSILIWLDRAISNKSRNWEFNKIVKVFSTQLPKLEKTPELSQFHNFCERAWEESENTGQLFSDWLSSGQFYLCQFLVDMVSGGSGRKNHIVNISQSRLPDDSIDQIFLARKCVGFLWLHEVTAASILLSIVKNGKKLAREEAEELLYNPLLLSYSGDLRIYLEENRGSSSKRISTTVEKLLKMHEAYLTGLKSARNLVEFIPANEQSHVAALKDYESRKSLQNQVHEKSLFAQIGTRQIMLYGNKNLTFIQRSDGSKSSNLIPLSEFSHSMEIPRLTIVDPVGFNLIITNFKLEKKIAK